MINKDKQGNAQVKVNESNYIVHVKNVNFEGFALKFKIENNWYFQHLALSCRGSAKKYFNQAKILYIHIKKEKLTQQTFRRLAL